MNYDKYLYLFRYRECRDYFYHNILFIKEGQHR